MALAISILASFLSGCARPDQCFLGFMPDDGVILGRIVDCDKLGEKK